MKTIEEKIKLLGNNIRLRRVVKKRSQVWVQVETGINSSRISKIENGGASRVSLREILLIARALDVSIFDLLEEECPEEATIAEKAHWLRLMNFDREEYQRLTDSKR